MASGERLFRNNSVEKVERRARKQKMVLATVHDSRVKRVSMPKFSSRNTLVRINIRRKLPSRLFQQNLTGTVIARLGNPAVGMLDTAGSAN
jgi:hypothetical protein